MPTANLGVVDSFKAENDLSGKQYYAMELSADDQVDVCDGAGDQVIGILQNKPKASQAAAVAITGRTKWVSDGSSTAIAVGDRVGTDGSGKCVKKTAAADLIAGLALAASSADGTVIDVMLTLGGERSTT